MAKRTVTPKLKAAKKNAGTKKATVKAEDKEKEDEDKLEEDEDQPEAAASDKDEDTEAAEQDDQDDQDEDEEASDNDDEEEEVGAETDDEKTKAVKSRIQSIVKHPEAKGREDLAQEIAFNTSLSVNAAVGLLASAPRASATHNPLKAAMATVKNPKVGSKSVSATADANPILDTLKAHSPSRLVK